MSRLPKKFASQIFHFNEKERALISSAFLMAREKHKGQFRRSGKPYITHPLSVASTLAIDNHDSISVTASLLHDLLEDTKTTYDEIKSEFGAEIADLVQGVTKISSIKLKDKSAIFSDEEMYMDRVDNYRKILLATSTDLRVMIIKLYDRLHNIETIEFLPEHKRKFYARETIEIFAPIAERLGMGEIKGRLEDLAFPHAYPEEYEKFMKVARRAYKNPKEIIDNVIPEVKEGLTRAKIGYVSVSGRAKHLYSLYLKLKRRKNISLIFDIIALRIIMNNTEDCYRALGSVHSLYKPLPGQIDDYIARPKDNGYQSLHTTVKDDDDNVFEIQIRTEEMHNHAEHGTPAHWSYKERKGVKETEEWIVELKKIGQIKKGEDLIRTIKEELFSKKVFVFTPQGNIIDLPVGSCGIDFAYRIHTDVGNHCKKIKINRRLMPLRSILDNGDVVEIITSKRARPSKDWLKVVKTSVARNKINHYFRFQDSKQNK